MKTNLPDKYRERLKEQLGDEFDQYEACFQKKGFSGLRINMLKLTPEEFKQCSPYDIQRIPWITNGFYYRDMDQPSKHPFYFAGLYYLQEPSAMTPASLLPVTPGDKVLDLCAAPGGKSTELAAKLQGVGLLVSNDISNSRAKALLKNIELFGAKNVVVMSETPGKLSNVFSEYFDKILVDAPCSGEGMFRKQPSIMKNWEQYGVEYYAKLQREILSHAVSMLKPGGYLLYSTCTFSPEEDEQMISNLLSEYEELEIVPAIPKPTMTDLEFFSLDAKDQERLQNLQALEENKTLSYDGFCFGNPEWTSNGEKKLSNAVRLWPHHILGEGHFLALLKKEEKQESEVGSRKVFIARDQKRISPEAKEFLSKLRCTMDWNRLMVKENRIYLVPENMLDLTGFRILRSGLLLGEMKKNRFEPSQALALALRMDEYDNVYNMEASDEDVLRYLKCEAITLKKPCKDGYVLVCVEGYPLGFGKVNQGNFKNKYLPGWRYM